MPNQPKHGSLDEYKEWYSAEFGIDLETEKRLYEENAEHLKDSFDQSLIWSRLLKEIDEVNDQYYANTHFALLDKSVLPVIEIKPFESLLDKTYRINEIQNKNWPNEPRGGWIFPTNWFTKIKDIVRTKLVVRYLDGVTFMIDHISNLCGVTGIQVKSMLEAREQGYYAAHLL